MCAGSHAKVADLLWAGGPSGIEGGELSHRAREACQPQEGPQVEVNGRAGDVMLAHPFMLHARSKNLGKKVRCDAVLPKST